MEERAGTSGRIEPIISLLLAIFLGIFFAVYMQYHLNGVWDAAAAPAGQAEAPGAAAG